MASASTAKTERRLAKYTARRLAAARGETVPLSPAGWIRFVLRTLAILLLLIVCVPLHYLYRVFAYGSPFPMLFLRYTARIVGARVKVVGTPLRRDVFFIANHISWVDILSMAGASGTAFVAKQELSEVPVIGWLCRLNRTVFVKRENRLGVAQQINALKEALADNWSVTVFPEGTVTDGHSLLPFKSSMISVLDPPPPGVMVQPVVLDYGENSEEIGWVGEESGLHNAMRIMARRGTFLLTLHYLEPFSPVEHRGRKAISAKAREEIEERLVANLGKPLRDFQHVVDAVRYRPKPADTEAS
ncbi:lysophospholipid acyltransferase family protein [Erythrobacter sp.]|uniref:lysophospholipid acyltransferase family protein n=1 Tax=Erythrobacter sp. TaxID=1042 RepID=UPI001B1C23BD|nr:lysophospholipid acyltransferase family protein [Erythrobacter sp.]MBO6525861.1 1-acyl-sn-glycerol-3-phosphate acyltransferase [Erythrobacter sp.]MBO6529464.1 1-acyl-sn-glycerol-3-phosphate acyltransferase [Erythrobacter sp.]